MVICELLASEIEEDVQMGLSVLDVSSEEEIFEWMWIYYTKYHLRITLASPLEWFTRTYPAWKGWDEVLYDLLIKRED